MEVLARDFRGIARKVGPKTSTRDLELNRLNEFAGNLERLCTPYVDAKCQEVFHESLRHPGAEVSASLGDRPCNSLDGVIAGEALEPVWDVRWKEREPGIELRQVI